MRINTRSGFVILAVSAICIVVTMFIGVCAWNIILKNSIVMTEVNVIKAKYLSLAGIQCARRAQETLTSNMTYEIKPAENYNPVSFKVKKIGDRMSSISLYTDTSAYSGIWRVTSTAKVQRKSYTMIEEFDGSNYCYKGTGTAEDNYYGDQRYLLRRPVLKCR